VGFGLVTVGLFLWQGQEVALPEFFLFIYFLGHNCFEGLDGGWRRMKVEISFVGLGNSEAEKQRLQHGFWYFVVCQVHALQIARAEDRPHQSCDSRLQSHLVEVQMRQGLRLLNQVLQGLAKLQAVWVLQVG
jgi:hypothetical protein